MKVTSGAFSAIVLGVQIVGRVFAEIIMSRLTWLMAACSMAALSACDNAEPDFTELTEAEYSAGDRPVDDFSLGGPLFELPTSTPNSWSTSFADGVAGWTGQRERLDDQALAWPVGDVVQVDQEQVYEQTGWGDLYSRDRVRYLESSVYSARIRLRQTADPESGQARHIIGLFFLDENGNAVPGLLEALSGSRDVYLSVTDGWVERFVQFTATSRDAASVRVMVRLHQSSDSGDVANATVQVDSVEFSVQ